MSCRIEAVQAPEVRARGEVVEQDGDREEEWDEGWAASVVHSRALQGTACVQSAGSRLRIRPDFPATSGVAPSVEQKW